MSDNSNERNMEHRRQIQFAKKLARENMVANGLLSMGSSETIPNSIGAQKNHRRAMMDRERAMDQALHTNRSKFGQTILYGNETEKRKLEQRLIKLESERKISKFRIEHSKRMMTDEHYPSLTSTLTKAEYELKRSKKMSRASKALPPKAFVVERATTNTNLKGRIETPDYLPEVDLYTVREGESSLFRLHPTKRVLKRAASVESMELRNQFKELEQEILMKATLRQENRYQGLETILGKDQEKFRLDMLKTGTPKFRVRESSNTQKLTKMESLQLSEDKNRAKKEDLDKILSRYPFRKSYLRKKQQLEAL